MNLVNSYNIGVILDIFQELQNPSEVASWVLYWKISRNWQIRTNGQVVNKTNDQNKINTNLLLEKKNMIFKGRNIFLEMISFFPSTYLPDVLCDPSDLIWRKGIPFESMTDRTAPSSDGLLADVLRGFTQL